MVQTERIVKRLVQQGEYIEIAFADLKVGDVYMLYEPDGTDLGLFTAASDAYLNDNEIWEIQNK
jgi:hypothetical protein